MRAGHHRYTACGNGYENYGEIELMFTGIIRTKGTIGAIERRGGDVRMSITAPDLPWDDYDVGDSISVNGVCLTAVELLADGFVTDVSVETLDVTTLLASDGKFASGMYQSGKTRSEINEPYGVDEFMFFLEGGVTLTSSDGTVTEIGPGEGVTIPKEWTGIWDTDGYRKVWVIYSEDGSGL